MTGGQMAPTTLVGMLLLPALMVVILSSMVTH